MNSGCGGAGIVQTAGTYISDLGEKNIRASTDCPRTRGQCCVKTLCENTFEDPEGLTKTPLSCHEIFGTKKKYSCLHVDRDRESTMCENTRENNALDTPYIMHACMGVFPQRFSRPQAQNIPVARTCRPPTRNLESPGPIQHFRSPTSASKSRRRVRDRKSTRRVIVCVVTTSATLQRLSLFCLGLPSDWGPAVDLSEPSRNSRRIPEVWGESRTSGFSGVVGWIRIEAAGSTSWETVPAENSEHTPHVQVGALHVLNYSYRTLAQRQNKRLAHARHHVCTTMVHRSMDH
jgi:hypothetical protein